MNRLRALLEAVLGTSETGMLFDPREDPFASRVKALEARTTIFASGLSRQADFRPAAWCEHGIGVEIGELSDHAMLTLARTIVTYATPSFVDTGEFGRFKRSLAGHETAHLDFDRILSRYDQFLDLIADENEAEDAVPRPLLVAPDRVGDQQASFDLVRRHLGWIRSACAWGPSELVIPIQLGTRKPAEIYDAITQLLGTDNFRVGIPSNASAFSAHDFIDFMQAVRPKGLHFLGAFARSRLMPRLTQLVKADADDVISVSADGNPLRSVIITRGQGGHARAERLAAVLGARSRIDELRRYVTEIGGCEALEATLDGEKAGKALGTLTWALDLTEGEILAMHGDARDACDRRANNGSQSH